MSSSLLSDPELQSAVEPIGSGRNSRVYRVRGADGRFYAVKRCLRQPLEGRDRLTTEFDALQFLWDAGIRAIPRPVAADPAAGVAVYEWIEGERMPSAGVTRHDIDAAVEFIAALKALRDHPESHRLPIASEACFRLGTIRDTIEARLGRLATTDATGPQRAALEEFLHQDFTPAFRRLRQWCAASAQQAGWAVTDELPQACRTLSPSDFGFHNALRCADGRIVFLDFEHFGWDDPAKLIADFLLHPAMALSDDLKRYALRQLFACFCEQVDLHLRVRLAYPLFGLKWCMILLNEFVPQDRRRRDFATSPQRPADELQAEQLTKARHALHDVLETYERFPYADS